MRTMIIALVATAWVSPAGADAIDPEPAFCPPGTTAYSDHGGAGCRPEPPDDCPVEFVPRVSGEVAYCEPPPAEPCPTGTHANSFGPDQPFCQLGDPCANDADCAHGSSCRATRVCISPVRDPRFTDWRAHGECTSEEDCGEGYVCDDSPRCDPDVHRSDPAGRQQRAIVASSSSSGLVLAVCCCLAIVLALLGVGVGIFFSRKRAKGPRQAE